MSVLTRSHLRFFNFTLRTSRRRTPSFGGGGARFVMPGSLGLKCITFFPATDAGTGAGASAGFGAVADTTRGVGGTTAAKRMREVSDERLPPIELTRDMEGV